MSKKLIALFLILIAITLVCCYPTTKNYPLIDDIKQGDTLTLYSRYSECGEWGGHIEKIFLFKKESSLWATFYKDSVSCDADPNETRKKVIEKSKLISISDRGAIIKYIDNFILIYKKMQIVMWDNAANEFEIISKDSTMHFTDWTMKSSDFEEMRNKIFP